MLRKFHADRYFNLAEVKSLLEKVSYFSRHNSLKPAYFAIVCLYLLHH